VDELIDYLRVLWKWKWMIIVGTLLCTLTVAIYGFTRPVVKMYRVSALIEIDPEAELDPLDKIKSMIEYGVFNQRIIKDLSNLQGQGASIPGSLAFKVAIPKNLNMLEVAYKAANVDLGRAVLDSLIKQLKGEYKERLEWARSQFEETIKDRKEHIKNIQADIQIKRLNTDSEIARLKSEIRDIQANIQAMEKEFENNIIIKKGEIKSHRANIESSKEKIKILNDTIEQMKKVFQEAQSNREKLMAQREDKTGHVDIFMQTDAIHQIISYPIELRNQMNSLTFQEKDLSGELLQEENRIKDLEAQIELLNMKQNVALKKEQDRIRNLEDKIQVIRTMTKRDISAEQNKIVKLESEIESLKRDRDQISGIHVKQNLTVSPVITKFKTKRNVMLATVVGLFAVLFLAFFLEYIQRHRGSVGS